MIVIHNDLLKACQRGDRRACNQLYKELFNYLMNICIRYNNNYDEAGASVNAIFLKIVTNLEKRNTEKQLLPWVKTIAMNHLADEFRKNKALKNNVVFSDDADELDNNADPVLMHGSLEMNDLLRMIRSLPASCNRVFNLFAIDGYSHIEIAEMLGISEGTSRSQLHYARTKLQKMIEEEQAQSLKLKHLESAR